jgi:hypothetical protein
MDQQECAAPDFRLMAEAEFHEVVARAWLAAAGI